MKQFKITENIEVICEWKKTRIAFKHEATLIKDGITCETVKICYQNRTWERYEFESVLFKLIDKTASLSDEEKKVCVSFIKKDNTDNSDLKMVSMIAGLGNIFGNSQKEKNDWKTRMLKAGLENKGLEMPEDWNELSEDTKQVRLDAVIEQLR